jgi:hypothetical protein
MTNAQGLTSKNALQALRNSIDQGVWAGVTLTGCGGVIFLEFATYNSWFMALVGGGSAAFGVVYAKAANGAKPALQLVEGAVFLTTAETSGADNISLKTQPVLR